MVEVKDEERVHEVYESVADISLVDEVYRQVQEIVPSLIVVVDFLK